MQFASSFLLLLNTLQQKPMMDGFTAQVLGSYQTEKTAQPSQQCLYNKAIMVDPNKFFLEPNMDPQPCPSILSKIITNPHYPPGALQQCVSPKSVGRRMRGRNLQKDQQISKHMEVGCFLKICFTLEFTVSLVIQFSSVQLLSHVRLFMTP